MEGFDVLKLLFLCQCCLSLGSFDEATELFGFVVSFLRRYCDLFEKCLIFENCQFLQFFLEMRRVKTSKCSLSPIR